MPAIDITRWIISLLEDLQSSRQRQLLLLEGSCSWCDDRLLALSGLKLPMQLLSNRDLGPSAIPFAKADSCLGGEARLVVVDLFDGFNPDVLCIAVGLVRAGGILLLLSPAVEIWDVEADRYACWQDDKRSARAWFVEYFFSCLRNDAKVGITLTATSLPDLPAALPRLQETPIDNGLTAEQSVILQQIQTWVSAGRPGIALISADRGRGKSTCLGLLASRLQGLQILVTASSRQTAARLLQHAPMAEFVAPDQLMRAAPPAELLIVDEAAMIPLSMLRQLARLYPRLVMATTSGGYEGTGRGFMLRFVAELAAVNLIRHGLEKPVRWCQGDELEAWFNRTLMLKAETRAGASELSVSDCEIEILSDPGGAQAWPLLQQVYALLNSAHYRTRPSDLRMLMENPDLVVIVARQRGTVLGVVLLNLEGGFDQALCSEVFFGRRRPRGHLLAQMLTAQAGVKGFACYRGMRVQRIAVASAYRRQGLGTRLLEQALHYGRDNTVDYIGASFALEAATAEFWRKAHFRLVHISYAAGKSSGNHSIAVLRPIADGLEDDIMQLQQRIQQQLPTWMTQFLQAMDAAEVIALLRYAGYEAGMSDPEHHEIEAFATGNRGFEICFACLQKFVMQRVAAGAFEVDALLIEKAVQNRDWKLLERESAGEGRKQLQRRLRGLVDALRKDC